MLQQDLPSRPRIRSFWLTSVWTLISRVLGMLRDVATAALLGMESGGVMDAFAVAFRIPDVARRLFGEGILAAAYLPRLTGKFHQGESTGWKFVSETFSQWVLLLCGGWLLAEVLTVAGWYFLKSTLVFELIALMLPYVVLASLSAQLAGTLHTREHFFTPAFAPVILNTVWLVFAWTVAPSADPQTIARWLAVGIVLGGTLQFGLQWVTLRAIGWKNRLHWFLPNRAFWQMAITSVVTILGLGMTQLNTMIATFVAWIGSGENGSISIGAVSGLYLAERLYQFPLSLIGVALATVFYPSMSRSAAEADGEQLATQFERGLRLALFVGIPASVGLFWVAEPLTIVIYSHGAFSTEEAVRTSRFVATFATGLWAFCALPIIIRAWYALGNFRAPAWFGLASLLLNVIGLAVLVPVFGEIMLAGASVLAGVLQLLGLWMGLRTLLRCNFRTLLGSCSKAICGSVVMALVLLTLTETTDSTTRECLRQLLLSVPAGVGTYALCALVLRMPEWKWLLGKE